MGEKPSTHLIAQLFFEFQKGWGMREVGGKAGGRREVASGRQMSMSVSISLSLALALSLARSLSVSLQVSVSVKVCARCRRTSQQCAHTCARVMHSRAHTHPVRTHTHTHTHTKCTHKHTDTHYLTYTSVHKQILIQIKNPSTMIVL